MTTTIHVPADYSTIENAVNAAASGDTIQVSSGTYNEMITVTTSNLSIKGAQSGVDARIRDGNESIVQAFVVKAINIIIDGFTITNSTTDGVSSDNTHDVSGLQVINNIVKGNVNGVNIVSVEAYPDSGQYLVQYNRFSNNTGKGVTFGNTSVIMHHIAIDDNLFDGGVGNASVSLTQVTACGAVNNLLNNDNSINFIDCFIANIINNVSSGSKSTGIYISNVDTSNINDNYIYAATTEGISVNDDSTDITIESNAITGNSVGIKMENGNFDILISGNDIIDSTGAGIRLVTGNKNSEVIINGNDIQSNGTGLLVETGSYDLNGDPNLDATNNYWNSSSGPGTGDSITDPDELVNYTPFSTSAI